MKWEQSDTQKVLIFLLGVLIGMLIASVIIAVRLEWYYGYRLVWYSWLGIWMLLTAGIIVAVFAWAFEVWKSLPDRE